MARALPSTGSVQSSIDAVGTDVTATSRLSGSVIEGAGGTGAVRAKYVAATAVNLGIQGAPQQRHGGGTMKSKQTGITLIGFLIVLIVVAFFGYMVMKLFPSYTEYGGVVKAMEQEGSSGADGKTLDDIRRDLMRRWISNTSTMPASHLAISLSGKARPEMSCTSSTTSRCHLCTTSLF